MNRKERRATKGLGQSPRDGQTAGTASAAYQTALGHYQAGRMAEANNILGQILAADPRHADTHHLLGLMAIDLGRADIAEEMIRKALAVNDRPSAYHLSLGNALRAQKRFDDAIASYQHALDTDPRNIETLNNIAMVFEEQKKYPEAQTHYERAIKINPNVATLYFNLGNVLKEQKQYEAAEKSYEHALKLDQKDADILVNLGMIQQERHKTDAAIETYNQAIAINPNLPEAYFNLGNTLKSQGKLDEAYNSYARAAALKPYADANMQMGVILHDKGLLQSSIAPYEVALSLNPHSFEALNGLGITYSELGKYEQAIDLLERALAVQPQSKEVLSNLGIVYKNYGDLDKSVEYLKQALALSPDTALTYNNLLGCMIYAASVPPQEIYQTAKDFGERVADPLLRNRPLNPDKNPDRKLRIGYVSPDFRDHAVNYFFEPLLKLRNKDEFEIFLYSNNNKEDAITNRLKQETDHWHNISYLNNDKTADLIEADKIDILIDLTGHTANNRLLVFAKKPAPVQATWLGYPATTGMKAMDYRITDIYAEPIGMTEHLNTETLWRLPTIFCCYQAHENSPAVIDHPPFEDNDYITFGCFNNFSKVSDPVLETWAQIMNNVPNSRLLLEIYGIEETKFRSDVIDRITRAGLPMDRVILEPRKKSNQFVLYNKIDIALDPFPCAGGTTSMDTMWMGVPLITLAGEHFVSRMGVTILTNAGLPELIAPDTTTYIKLATELANDKDRLRSTRHNLRERVLKSPLMNQADFVKHMEEAYREMWNIYCAGQGQQ